MLVRFVVENLFSFGEQKEFNMLPGPKGLRMKHHRYVKSHTDLLKLSVMYGANGAGKSNLIKAMDYLAHIVREEAIPAGFRQHVFRFHTASTEPEVLLGIEFIAEGVPFVYALKFRDNLISTEELYIAGGAEGADQLIFERNSSRDGTTRTRFSEDFEADAESSTLKKVIEKNLSKPDKPLFRLLSTLDNPFLRDLEKAYRWFERSLEIIRPTSKPAALAHRIDKEESFRKYANETMRAFQTGVINLHTETKTLREFFGEDNINELDDLLAGFDEGRGDTIGLRTRAGEEILLVKEGNEVLVKRLVLEHEGKEGKTARFYAHEESDGTVRLLDYIPAFEEMMHKEKVYIIDEIERSIHPLLIKELIRKFSHEKKTRGQLFFTTHESNLLDQEIFRQDEIWFAEKDLNGSTDLYPLSEFKEHHTKNIRKGYLNGRYGAIPFLGNLQDLNWNSYATTE